MNESAARRKLGHIVGCSRRGGMAMEGVTTIVFDYFSTSACVIRFEVSRETEYDCSPFDLLPELVSLLELKLVRRRPS